MSLRGIQQLQLPDRSALTERVRSKLRSSVLRRIEGAQQIRRSPDYVAYKLHRIGGEAAIVLAGFGISHPVVAWLEPEMAPDGAAVDFATAWSDLALLPTPLLVFVLTLVAMWLALLVWVAVRHLRDRGPLMEACCREFDEVQAKLEQALERANPLEGIDPLVEESSLIVSRYRAPGVWPWPVGPTDAEAAIDRRIEELIQRHQHHWRVADAA